MKKCSAALLNLLNTATNLCMMDLITITLTNGTVLNYTTGDYSINVSGTVYTPMTMDVGEIKQSIGLSVDDLAITWYYNANDTVMSNVPIAEALRSGAFDYAIVQLSHVFMTTWQLAVSSDYVLLDFIGRLDTDSAGRTKAELKIKSITDLLNIKLPRVLYQPGCVNALYDPNTCGVNRAAYTTASTVTGGSTQTTLNCGLTQASAYFQQGAVTFTSGLNAGVIATVKSYTPGVVNFMWPLPFMPAVGDSFTIVPGCDRSIPTCTNKFGNFIHYRGTPYIPVPSVTV